MISQVAVFDDTHKKVYEANFNQTYVIFDAVATSLIDEKFVGTSSNQTHVDPSRSRELSLETDV